MSVKQIQERICASKNEVLEAKLQEIAECENIDNYSLNMISDSYEFGLIYAVSRLVLGVVKIQESEICKVFQERWCNQKKSHAELVLA